MASGAPRSRAEALGLSPRPSGGNPWSWEARCPGTNHSLMLQAKSGEWGCGWCRRKGGVEELKEFVAVRRTRTSMRSAAWSPNSVAWARPSRRIRAAQLHSAGPLWRGRSHLECVARRRLDSDDRRKGRGCRRCSGPCTCARSRGQDTSGGEAVHGGGAGSGYVNSGLLP